MASGLSFLGGLNAHTSSGQQSTAVKPTAKSPALGGDGGGFSSSPVTHVLAAVAAVMACLALSSVPASAIACTAVAAVTATAVFVHFIPVAAVNGRLSYEKTTSL
ncbi:hypothetical protein TYRP_014309 [Tyrophagus putrescentiae]|nr:hypothetical protein TYRP_014309 [Tyrophagus putrescentiae]